MAEHRRAAAADPWIEAVAFAIREARRLASEHAAERDRRRAKLTVIDGSRRGERTA